MYLTTTLYTIDICYFRNTFYIEYVYSSIFLTYIFEHIVNKKNRFFFFFFWIFDIFYTYFIIFLRFFLAPTNFEAIIMSNAKTKFSYNCKYWSKQFFFLCSHKNKSWLSPVSHISNLNIKSCALVFVNIWVRVNLELNHILF